MSNETVTVSREEYESLKATNEELRQANENLAQQLQNLIEQIALARKQRYGSSSEQTIPSDIGEQLSYLFNEAEFFSDAAKEGKQPEEPDLTTVKEHTRSQRRMQFCLFLKSQAERNRFM